MSDGGFESDRSLVEERESFEGRSGKCMSDDGPERNRLLVEERKS